MAQRISIPESRRTREEQAVVVVVGLLTGEVCTGKLSRFHPTMTELPIETEGTRGPTFLPAERVAWIGFERANGGPEVLRDPSAERYRVHVAGGRVFTVDAKISSPNAIGFLGHPEPTSPFAHVFFYAHGVNAKEKDVPIGEMMLESGLLGPQSLRRGVTEQAARRSIPIGQILVEQGAVEPSAVEHAASLQARRKLRIGQVLVEAGLATAEAVDRALATQKQQKGKRLGEVLVEMGVVSETDLAMTLAQKFQIPFVDLDTLMIDPAAAEQVGRDVIARWGVLPVLATSTAITIAIADPLAVDAIDALRLHCKRRIAEILVVPSQLKRHVQEYLRRAESQAIQAGAAEFDNLLATLKVEDLRAAAESEDEDAIDLTVSGDADGGIVRLVNQIIIDAYRRGASDIHIEPNGKETTTVIRFRIDGDCVAYQEVPSAYRQQIIARVKIMASLDISERRKPQDGKIRFRVGERMIELRVATLPTVNGNEDAVLRILASAKPLPLERMGLSERNLHEIRHAIEEPHGLVLCVGPTGSGKTTTLHSALGAINTADRKIWTAEDPVEITQPGLRQMQVAPKIGLTFASAMRAFLRADPDVIMIGEMRDLETAETAIEASLTGHLVLSTLHTNSAPETITRLLDMGLDPFGFADSLVAIIAQRLVRTLCNACRSPVAGSAEDYEEIASAYGEDALVNDFGIARTTDFQLFHAVGCDACSKTGYRGRIAIHEVLVADPAIRHAMGRRAPVAEIRALATAGGMKTLLADGIAKVLAGATDLKQVLAVATK